MKIVLAIFSIILFTCTQKNQQGKLITINKPWLDSIIGKSDSSYSKHYRNSDFVTAEYFVNRKDSIVCQVMKDSMGNIRQILVAKKSRKLFGAEYYKNGQLVASLPIDAKGKYNGTATYYYENGVVKITGSYVEGFRAGKWRNYQSDGILVSTDTYNDKGEMVKTSKP
jgi:antitoxin component YwqK of YwqJK toxin-antitoxin module